MIGGVRKALEGFRGTNGLVVHVTDARWTLDGRECSVLTTLIRGRHMAFERASLLRVYKQVNLDLRFDVGRLDPTRIAGVIARFFDIWVKVNKSVVKIGRRCGKKVFI